MRRGVSHKTVITYTLNQEEATRLVFHGAERATSEDGLPGPVGPPDQSQMTGIGEEVSIVREYEYTPPPELSGGMAMILAERMDHADRGYDADHDDNHEDDALAIEASQLAVDTTSEQSVFPDLNCSEFGLVQKYRGDRIKQLAVAASLLAAEIDRLIRSGVTP